MEKSEFTDYEFYSRCSFNYNHAKSKSHFHPLSLTGRNMEIEPSQLIKIEEIVTLLDLSEDCTVAFVL